MTVNLQRRIARVDTDGTVSAIRQFGTSGRDLPFGIDVRDGVVYVSGMTEGALAGRAGGATDVFVVPLDARDLRNDRRWSKTKRR
jgi:hypothetical protein